MFAKDLRGHQVLKVHLDTVSHLVPMETPPICLNISDVSSCAKWKGSNTTMKIQVLYCYCCSVAQGLLRDIERYYNERIAHGLPGPPGPPGAPGYSRLFGSSTNVTDIMEYIRSNVTFNIVPPAVVNQKKLNIQYKSSKFDIWQYVFWQYMEPLWGHLEDKDRKGTWDSRGPKEREVNRREEKGRSS